MQGQAFKCDGCGRVSFSPNEQTGAPPEGWFALSQANKGNTTWSVFHFDGIECLAEFAWSLKQKSMPAEAPSSSEEVVFSSWEASHPSAPVV